MGTSHRKDDIRAFLERAKRDAEAVADARATVEQFNARLATGKTVWAWPTIGAALASGHPWLVIVCDACDIITEMDLRMKRRDPDASIQVALTEARCPRCNGSGRPRIAALKSFLT